MHFSKQLRFLAYKPWKKKYIDFYRLKHKLKQVKNTLIEQGSVKTLPTKRAQTPTSSTPPPNYYSPASSPRPRSRFSLEEATNDMEVIEVVRPEPLRSEFSTETTTEPPIQIALLTPETEEEILSVLWEERDKVGDFFRQKAEETIQEIISISTEAKLRKENGNPFAPLKKRLLDALITCEELCDYSRTNLIGFTKFIKKIARHTNFSSRKRVEVILEIHQAPFVTMLPSIETLKERIKQQYIEIFRDESSSTTATSPSSSSTTQQNEEKRSNDAKILKELEDAVNAARSWKFNTVLAQVDEHLEKARIVEHKKHTKVLPIAISLVVFIILMFAPIFPSDLQPAQRCLGVLLFGTIMWITECVPLFVTAILIIIITPPSLILLDSTTGELLDSTESTSQVFKRLFPSSIPLVLAGFSISQAFKKYEIDLWIASHVLGAKIFHTPRRFLFAIMILCAFLSMWISNIAAPVLTLTLMMPVLRDLPESCTDYRKSLLMATAIAGNIGGMTTQIASPQNAVTVSLEYPVSFIHFIVVSLPIWPFLLIGGYVLLLIFYKMDVSTLPPIEKKEDKQKQELRRALTGSSTSRSAAAAILNARHSMEIQFSRGHPIDLEELHRASLDLKNGQHVAQIHASVAEAKRKKLREGRKIVHKIKSLPWKIIVTVSIVVLSIGLWIASNWLSPFGSSIGLISFIPLALFYSLGLLTKEDFEKLPWGIVMLLSGGNILGYAVESSGLLQIVASLLEKLPSNLFLLCVVTNLITILASTFISSTVASLILLPLAGKIGASAGGHPRVLIMSAVIVCSGAMGLPISCFPNINASSVENFNGKPYLSAKDFFKVGGCFTILTFIGSISIIYGMSLAIGF